MAKQISRRQALTRLAVGAAAPAVPLPAFAETPMPTTPAQQPSGMCVLFPQAVEGPYYFDPKLERADISEGRPGQPMKLALRIIESGPCTPIYGARVDVWHCDAGGIYSGYARQGDERDVSTVGQSYLRGTQTTDADGRVTFNTIYPGWYPGRTPHIHIKVFLSDKTLVTGQVYFPDDVTEKIYTTHAQYNNRPIPDTTNKTDFIFREGEREGGGIVLAIDDEGGAMVAALLIAIDKSGDATRNAEGWGGKFRRWLGR